ncbi:hypothetical protein I3842_Q043400 [Carya illinoinensis]|uniref:Uncharacterized protein n=1 Tax=Carya illinoinensis TaxID=32201 RepID=A0A921ZYT1_CARIL|nr:hypothetical protein I3842_Q043400 [Carya illinoinensis]
MLIVTHYWLIENQSRFTNESRNAMVLKYDLLIYSKVPGLMSIPKYLVYCKTYYKKCFIGIRRERKKASRYANSSSSNQSFPMVYCPNK